MLLNHRPRVCRNPAEEPCVRWGRSLGIEAGEEKNQSSGPGVTGAEQELLMAVHAYNPGIWEAEAGGSDVQPSWRVDSATV